MPKKQQEKQVSPLGYLALGFLACTPGILLLIAAEYNLQWLGLSVIWLILISCILFLIFLLCSNNELRTGCKALLFLIGLLFLFGSLFGRRK